MEVRGLSCPSPESAVSTAALTRAQRRRTGLQQGVHLRLAPGGHRDGGPGRALLTRKPCSILAPAFATPSASGPVPAHPLAPLRKEHAVSTSSLKVTTVDAERRQQQLPQVTRMNLGEARGYRQSGGSCPLPGCCGLTAESGTAAVVTLTGCPENDQVRRAFPVMSSNQCPARCDRPTQHCRVGTARPDLPAPTAPVANGDHSCPAACPGCPSPASGRSLTGYGGRVRPAGAVGAC